MVVARKYKVMDMEKGRLDRSIFVDERVYQEELEKVFGRAWLFIGHESLIPNPNDFFLSYMGEDPVILTRDSKGQVHAFLNMCRHRGNRVVRADDGNAKNFMCTYHGWTFSNEGRLVSVPGLQEAYYGELDVDNLGLVPVAHLDTYAGFVFATWAQDAPTLEANLGDMRWYMDVLFNRRDGGVELIGPDKWKGPFNWKNSADNFIGDMYHGAVSHRSAMIAQAMVRGLPPRAADRFGRPGNQVNPGNGHGCYTVLFDTQEERWNGVGGEGTYSDGAMREYERMLTPEMERRLGEVRSRVGYVHYTLFPNMSWLSSSTVRMWHPRGPGQTETWNFVFYDKHAPPEIKHARRVNLMRRFGSSGTWEQDDMDNWHHSTIAGGGIQARKSRQELSMGIGHEQVHPVLPGKLVPNTQAEINQRAMYLRWQEFMNAGSWVDIHIDPITATFEGTATMKG